MNDPTQMNYPTQIEAVPQQNSIVPQDRTTQDEVALPSTQEMLGGAGSAAATSALERFQGIACILAIGAARAVSKGGGINSPVC